MTDDLNEVNIFEAAEEDIRDVKHDPVADAEKILNDTDYDLLKCAWDMTKYIKHVDDAYDRDKTDNMVTPAWYGLKKLVEHHGDFNKFTAEDHMQLRALKEGFLAYSEIIHLLIDHHNDEEGAKKLFELHPEIHGHLPKAYDTPKHALEVLLETVKDYQWQLEHFSTKYEADIAIRLAQMDQDQAAES